MAIKDRITKKTAKTEVAAVKRKAKIRSGIDVLDFFEMNKSISGLYIYDSNNIFVEKDGVTQRSDEVFDISLSDLIRVIVSKYENNFISVGDSYVIVTENGTRINILSKPYLKSGNFITFKKKRIYDYSREYFLKHQILDNDVSEYLREKIRNGENIFVVGASSADKLPVLSYLSGLENENIAVIQGLEDILTDAENQLIFSKYSLPFKEVASKAFELNHSLVVTECSDITELMSVFEFINSGFKHFIAAFNVNSKEDFLENLKNLIMLNYPQMSESKINGLIVSAIKNIVFLEKMADGETRASNVCTLKSGNGEIIIDDVFNFDFANFCFVKATQNQRKNKKIKKVRKVVIRRKKPVIKPEETEKEILPEKEIKVIEPELIETEVIPPVEQSVEEVQETVTEKPEEISSLNFEKITEPAAKEPETITYPNILKEEVEVKINKYKLLKEKIKHLKERN